jgi:predicted extracellular nuclease
MRTVVLLMLVIVLPIVVVGQDAYTFAEKKRDFRIMFYNCENLFDTENDSLINDEDFLPEGKKHWTPDKYWEKQKKKSKVIAAAGGWQFPDLVGLCEIENRKVLNDLIYKTPLSKAEYKIVHYESPDRRGIDVALLYNNKTFKVLFSKAIEVKNPKDPKSKTRDILYTKGLLKNNDTLHVFVNHWPSRWGGQMESEYKRVNAAQTLRKVTDSIQRSNALANIVIVGDFNDEPENKSMKETLGAKEVGERADDNALVNVSWSFQKETGRGSHKYHGVWGMLDQCVVSGALFGNNTSTKTSMVDFTVFNAPFLLEEDDRYLGEQPSRTYRGMRYHAGYSDHLPIILDLHFMK